ncbi:MAG: hypothetical protein CMA70_04370 [Euryarchaeota archaeon]|nr:hypothetical protein [Euryarchaeota archaeon]|tara:strand:- start:8096 stop:8830 length:735 start_codon:yes stop_codon:yes gene_type:complete
MDGDPRMKIDREGYLRPESWQGDGRYMFLGDVAKAVLRYIGPHDPPEFDSQPGYDEQRWELKSTSGEVTVKITSESYWGFGLFARCFYNRIEIHGPLPIRARCIHDVVASLGRNPWEPFWLKRFERITGAESEEHQRNWMELVRWASEDMRSQIDELEQRKAQLKSSGGDEEALRNASLALEEAVAALEDRNAPAVERALGRANSALIEADPSTEVLSSNYASIVLKQNNATEDEIPFVDLSEE